MVVNKGAGMLRTDHKINSIGLVKRKTKALLSMVEPFIFCFFQVGDG